jgi:phosphatidylglycerophosphate synthase
VFSEAKAIYLATRKRNDQLFNIYFMRPIAGMVVAIAHRTPVTPNQLTLLSVTLFAVAAALLIALPSSYAGLVAVAVVELSYLFDCSDGMLARHKKIASVQGHLFDFFTDEIKAVLLVGAVGVHLWRSGGYGIDAARWLPGDARFLLATIVAVAVIASATSLTNFVRRPEMSGKETPVDAHYETVESTGAGSALGRAVGLVMTFLRFIVHYPSHIWLFALLGRLDAFFWIYSGVNLLYVGRGWLGLVLRFGR